VTINTQQDPEARPRSRPSSTWFLRPSTARG